MTIREFTKEALEAVREPAIAILVTWFAALVVTIVMGLMGYIK